MQSYIDFLDKYKIKLIIFITLFVALMSISIQNIAYEGSYRIWFSKESKIMKEYDIFRSTFSGDDFFIVAFEDEEGIFREKPINTILELTPLLENIKGVSRVNSLTNYQEIHMEDEDVYVDDFIIDTSNLHVKKKMALKDELILNQLISKDGQTTMLAVKLANSLGADEEVNLHVMSELEHILEGFSESSSYNFHISGAPAITASLVTISQHDVMMLLPIAVMMTTLFLFILFRSFMGVLIPSVVIVFTFFLVLSIQMMLGYKLNNFTVNIPPFVTAIAIADAMHLYLAFIYYKMKEVDNREAVYLALKTNFLPIALTSFTTAVGFASLSISAIEPVSTLGIAITSAAIIAFILSVTIAPAILLMLDDSYKVKPIRILNLLHVKGYGAFIVLHDKKIVGLFVLVLGMLAYGLNFVKVDSNSIKFFSDDTVVRSGSNFIQEKLSGAMVYEIIVDSGEKDGIKEPQFLQKIITFEEVLKNRYPRVTFTTSLKDIIVRMQAKLNPDSTEHLPSDKNLIGQYLLLYSMSLPQGMEINDKIDTYEQKLRLTINSKLVETSKDLEMITWINQWWQNESEYSAEVQGQSVIFAFMQSSVTDTLIISILVTLVIVALVMLLIFRDIKMLWLFILANVAPIILVAGAMGYLGIDIDIGVAISAAVILGIAVDDSIHFFSKYFDAIQTKSFEETIDYIISHSGNAMILTTVILSLTFALFGVSSFMPNVHFAIVTIIALNLALLLDLVLLPALLSLFYTKRIVDGK